ncbi:MAG: hypothetical protein ACRCX5_14425 [Bacteroidales bacterium]
MGVITIEQFESYLNGAIAPLIKDRVFDSSISEDRRGVELRCENNISINFILNDDESFSWYVSSFGKEFDDIDDSEERLSVEIEPTYIGENVNMGTLISFDEVDQKPLFERVSDYANSIRKCIKCRKWYDKHGYINIYKYSSEIDKIRSKFYNIERR